MNFTCNHSPGTSGKEFTWQCRCKRPRFSPWVRKIPWKMKWQPTPVFLPGKAHGQRSQMGYSPWVTKSRSPCSWAHTHTHTCVFLVVQLYSSLCDPMDCSTPGSSVHGLSQARILEWVASTCAYMLVCIYVCIYMYVCTCVCTYRETTL